MHPVCTGIKKTEIESGLLRVGAGAWAWAWIRIDNRVFGVVENHVAESLVKAVGRGHGDGKAAPFADLEPVAASAVEFQLLTGCCFLRIGIVVSAEVYCIFCQRRYP